MVDREIDDVPAPGKSPCCMMRPRSNRIQASGNARRDGMPIGINQGFYWRRINCTELRGAHQVMYTITSLSGALLGL